MSKMVWHSFECVACFHAGGSKDTGVVFEVRCEAEELSHAACPICSARCELRGSWDADEGGYGSSSNPPKRPETGPMRDGVEPKDTQHAALVEEQTWTGQPGVCTLLIEEDLHERWIADHPEEMAKHAGEVVAVHLVQGIVASGSMENIMNWCGGNQERKDSLLILISPPAVPDR